MILMKLIYSTAIKYKNQTFSKRKIRINLNLDIHHSRRDWSGTYINEARANDHQHPMLFNTKEKVPFKDLFLTG